jgi:hypothetical protein
MTGCSNPCEKLASAVCAKAQDANICEQAKKDAKKSGNKALAECKKQLSQVDEVVKFLKAAEAAKKGEGQVVEAAPSKLPLDSPAPPPAPAPAPPEAPGK